MDVGIPLSELDAMLVDSGNGLLKTESEQEPRLSLLLDQLGDPVDPGLMFFADLDSPFGSGADVAVEPRNDPPPPNRSFGTRSSSSVELRHYIGMPLSPLPETEAIEDDFFFRDSRSYSIGLADESNILLEPGFQADPTPQELKDTQGSLKRRFHSCPNLQQMDAPPPPPPPPPRELPKLPLPPPSRAHLAPSAHARAERSSSGSGKPPPASLPKSGGMRSITSCPDMSVLALGAGGGGAEDERRQQRLARSRAAARMRRQRKKSTVELCEAESQRLEEALGLIRGHRWGEGCAEELRRALAPREPAQSAAVASDSLYAPPEERRQQLRVDHAVQLQHHAYELSLGVEEAMALPLAAERAAAGQAGNVEVAAAPLQGLDRGLAAAVGAGAIYNGGTPKCDADELLEALVLAKLLRCAGALLARTTALSAAAAPVPTTCRLERAVAAAAGDRGMGRLLTWAARNRDTIDDLGEEGAPPPLFTFAGMGALAMELDQE